MVESKGVYLEILGMPITRKYSFLSSGDKVTQTPYQEALPSLGNSCNLPTAKLYLNLQYYVLDLPHLYEEQEIVPNSVLSWITFNHC